MERYFLFWMWLIRTKLTTLYNQPENWIKYMKWKFSYIGQQAAQDPDLWKKAHKWVEHYTFPGSPCTVSFQIVGPGKEAPNKTTSLTELKKQRGVWRVWSGWKVRGRVPERKKPCRKEWPEISTEVSFSFCWLLGLHINRVKLCKSKKRTKKL